MAMSFDEVKTAPVWAMPCTHIVPEPPYNSWKPLLTYSWTSKEWLQVLIPIPLDQRDIVCGVIGSTDLAIYRRDCGLDSLRMLREVSLEVATVDLQPFSL